MSKVKELIDKVLEDLDGKVDKYTLNAFSTVVFSMIIEQDYPGWIRIKELLEKVVAKCDAGLMYYHKTDGDPAEMLPGFVEFAFFVKVALHIGREIEMDYAKSLTPPELR
jgi:hypothetical protein